MTKKKVRKAVLPVAGLGTRFLPATKAVPKEMLPLVDTPSIQMIVEECVAAGIEEIIFVTARGKSAMEDHFDRSGELEALLEKRGKTADLERARAPASLVRLRSRPPPVARGRPAGVGDLRPGPPARGGRPGARRAVRARRRRRRAVRRRAGRRSA